MDDVFELLSRQNVYVQGVRLIPVGFKTKLNTLFDIAVVILTFWYTVRLMLVE